MKIFTLFIFLVFLSVSLLLKCLNLKYLRDRGDKIPSEFSGSIDPQIMQKTMSYTAETTALGIIVSIFNSLLVVFFLFGGIVVIYDNWIGSLSESFVAGGCAFFPGTLLCGDNPRDSL